MVNGNYAYIFGVIDSLTVYYGGNQVRLVTDAVDNRLYEGNEFQNFRGLGWTDNTARRLSTLEAERNKRHSVEGIAEGEQMYNPAGSVCRGDKEKNNAAVGDY
ncbi:MAG: hypothetical protein II752_04530 [Muribaculaceae bacterium]|nr:hypothetical protein [Muribaculaceae bacterium]